MDGSRVVIALGGNALAPARSAGTAAEQTETIARTMKQVADLVAEDEVVITHGNGPQVGNLLIKNELAKDVVPPVPLDWCVAQTQATIGFTIASTLSSELRQRGSDRPVVPVVSRVRVAPDDPAWDEPTKPIGPYLTDEERVRRHERESGHRYLHQGSRGWRRVVPSPEPLASVDLAAILLLLADGALVVANGGGGIPVVDDPHGPLRGVEAVIDKDLSAALLAIEIGARALLILTDVPAVALHHGSDRERWLGTVTAAELRRCAGEGHFRAGSMGPKVEAVCRFVERGGARAAIGALDDAVAVAEGRRGTQVLPDAPGAAVPAPTRMGAAS